MTVSVYGGGGITGKLLGEVDAHIEHTVSGSFEWPGSLVDNKPLIAIRIDHARVAAVRFELFVSMTSDSSPGAVDVFEANLYDATNGRVVDYGQGVLDTNQWRGMPALSLFHRPDDGKAAGVVEYQAQFKSASGLQFIGGRADSGNRQDYLQHFGMRAFAA